MCVTVRNSSQYKEPLQTLLPDSRCGFGSRESRPEKICAFRNRIQCFDDNGRQRAIDRRSCLCRVQEKYLSRKNPGSKHTWYYIRNLGGDSAGARAGDENPEQKHQALLKQIVARKQLLKSAEKWERPGSVAGCLLAAIRDEGIESTKLDQVLAPFWATLWALAARGHWLRHERQPVRSLGPNEDDFRSRIILPEPLHVDEFELSFTAVGYPELGVSIHLGSSRRLSFVITRYPDVAEFRAMLDGWPMKRSWNGRHFVATPSKEKGVTQVTLRLRQNDVSIDFTEKEWAALRELFQKAGAFPEIERWLEELRLEYGEQG